MAEVIGGINPVLEALKARGEAFQRLYLAKGRGGNVVQELTELAGLHMVRVERVDRSRLDHLYGASGHQGVVAVVGAYGYFSLEDILEKCPDSPALILVLDGIQDPMNLGSLIRSADGAGACGVIVPRERAAPLTPSAIKASAGAVEHMPVSRVVNLARTLDRLKEEGFWIVGTEADCPDNLYEAKLPERLALVIGGEGRGVRRLVKEKCDLLVHIPLRGRISSLNASIAGALAMFEYVRQTGRAAS